MLIGQPLATGTHPRPGGSTIKSMTRDEGGKTLQTEIKEDVLDAGWGHARRAGSACCKQPSHPSHL